MRKKGLDFSFTTKFEIDELEYNLKIDVEDFRPSRPAPPCSNPDSPRYSDCGDDAEWNNATASLVKDNGTIIPITEEQFLDYIFDDYVIIGRIIEKGEELSQEKEWADEKYLDEREEQRKSDKYLKERGY